MAYFPVTPSGLRTDSTEARARAPRTARFVALGALFAVLAVTFFFARASTGGAYVYPVDDAYIHMAAAKRLLLAHDASLFSASSSVLWPWLLVLARFASLDDSAPLVWNLVAAAALFELVRLTLERFAPPRTASFAALAVCFVVPIVPLVLSGMEHTAHAAASVALATLGARAVAEQRKLGVSLLAAAALTGALRYEGAFVVGATAFLFFAASRRREALALLTAGALPAVARGVVSVVEGGFFFPVPVLMKRTVLGPELPVTLYYRLVDNPHLLVLFAGLACAWSLDRDATDPRARERRALAFVAATTLGAHVVLAQVGWFYRYEAYAVALALVAIGATALTHRAALRPFSLVLAVAAVPLVGRAGGAFRTAVLASRNIYDQELQTAAFIRAWYDTSAVAVNDIGAPSYLTNARVVDLIGLASPRIAAARGMRIDRPLPERAIEDETNAAGVEIAVVYDAWFTGTLPPSWQRVGGWTIPDNHVCAFDTVSVYATRPETAAIARERFASFVPRLPAGDVAK